MLTMGCKQEDFDFEPEIWATFMIPGQPTPPMRVPTQVSKSGAKTWAPAIPVFDPTWGAPPLSASFADRVGDGVVTTQTHPLAKRRREGWGTRVEG